MRCSLFVVLLGITACGGEDNQTTPPDAAASFDSSPDAAPATGSCSVLVYDVAGVPVEGATLVVRTAGAEFIGEATTDDQGYASRDDCQDGGMLTVARRLADATSVRASTFIAVPLDTTIQVGSIAKDSPVVTPNYVADVAQPTPANTTAFFATIGCDSTVFDPLDGPRFASVRASCLNEGSVDLLVSAREQGRNIAAFAWLLGTSPVDDGVTEAGVTSDWQDAEPVTMSVTDVPEAQITVEQQLSVVRGDLTFHTLAGVTTGGPSIGTFQVESSRPPTGFADGLRWFIDVRSQGTSTGMVSIESATASTLTRSVNELLPAVLGLLASGEPASPMVQWSANGDLSPANLAATYLDWKTGASNHRHEVFFPGGAQTSISVPPLPEGFEDAVRPVGIPLGLSAVFVDHQDLSYTQLLEAGHRVPALFATRALVGTGSYRVSAFD